MIKALAGKPVVDFPKPETIVAVTINPATGDLADENTPNRREEFYIMGTEPMGAQPEAAPEPAPPPTGDEPAPAADN